MPKNDSETLQREKYRFCVHKDEPVIGIGRAWKTTHNRKRTNNAYPRVISNLGCVSCARANRCESPRLCITC